MGVPLASRNLAQVSMNLTDFEQTPMHRVFEAVRCEAARYGVTIAGSEIIGLVPNKAVAMSAEWYLQVENFRPELILENRLAQAATNSGLDEFLDALAAPTATPGGGSAAAAAGAMAGALGAMVAGLAKLDTTEFDAHRRFFSEAVQRDARAYDAVVAAYRIPKAERGDAVDRALREAAMVPLEVAERAAGLSQHLGALAETAPAKFRSDIETADALAQAATAGAVANVRINLDSIKIAGIADDLRRRLAALFI
jgi:formiminotetrahydrofolate cyclodeaminase